MVSLAGAGSFGAYQTKQLGKAEATLEAKNLKIAEKEATITNLQIKNKENIANLSKYQANVRLLKREKAKAQAKALKDVTRIERISKNKSKLYERLINIDYAKTQRELEELTK